MTDFKFDIESYRLKPGQLVAKPLFKHADYCLPDIDCNCGLEEALQDEMREDVPIDEEDD